jgi:hypothetical protein
MRQAIGRRSAILVGGITIAVLAGALIRPHRPTWPTDHATPDDCLAAFRDASLDGDAARYRRCLAGPLRAETDRLHGDDATLASALREARLGVKHWVESCRTEETPERVVALIDEVRPTGQRQLRVQLERLSTGWFITAIERGPERPAPVRYGTPAPDPQPRADDDP